MGSKRIDKVWRDVVGIDATDLEEWIEAAPGVGRRLAAQMGVPVAGMRDLDLFLKELDATHSTALPPALLIGGRDEPLTSVQDWLSGDSQEELVIEGESPEEAAAFAAAAMMLLPDGALERAVARTLFIDTADAADYLTGSGAALTVVPMTTEARRRMAAGRGRGTRLLTPAAAASATSSPRVDSVRLGRVRRAAVESALQAAGISEGRAGRIATECRGSLTAALWMIADRLDEPPAWTRGEATRELAPLLLAGRWDPSRGADRDAVAQLCRMDYEAVERLAARWETPAGPLVRRGNLWDWLAPEFAWSCLVGRIDPTLLQTFGAVVDGSLGRADPQLELPPDRRFMADLLDKSHPHSQALRSGLVGSLVRLSVGDGQLPAGCTGVAAALVGRLLGADSPDPVTAWLSLSPWLADLAEASPDAFLGALGELVKNDRFVHGFFGEVGLIPSSPHTHLLWALERLAWSPSLLTRVTLALGDLAAVDPGGRLTNRPTESLRAIFLPWFPQTEADAERRLDALDALHRCRPQLAWNLAAGLLPRAHQASLPTDHPRWREVTATGRSDTEGYRTFNNSLVDRLLMWVGGDGGRWRTLLEAYPDVIAAMGDIGARITEAAASLTAGSFPAADRAALCESLRRVVVRHREFPGSDWSLAEEALAPLDALLERLRPEDPRHRHGWLFGHSPSLPGRYDADWDARQQRLADARAAAAGDVLESGGIDGLLGFAAEVERPDLVGRAAASLTLTEADEAKLLAETLGVPPEKYEVPALLRAGLNYAGARFHLCGEPWLRAVLDNPHVGWDDDRRANLAWSLPATAATWDLVADWGIGVEQLYWLRTPVGLAGASEAEGERAVRMLMGAGRPHRAVHLLSSEWGRSRAKAGSRDLILAVLNSAQGADPKEEWFAPSINDLIYPLGRLFDALEQGGADPGTMVALEWAWFPLLEQDRRGHRALRAALTEEPAFFVQMLEMVFRREGEPRHPPAEDADHTEAKKRMAQQAQELLTDWHDLPGVRWGRTVPQAEEGDIPFHEGEVDGAALQTWINTTRALAAERGRAGVCDNCIGQLFAHAPANPNGAWPAEPVRRVIEQLASADVDAGLNTGIFNRRGAMWRGEGGGQERRLSDKFRSQAEQAESRWPRTAAVLRNVADRYAQQARREDGRAAFGEFEG